MQFKRIDHRDPGQVGTQAVADDAPIVLCLNGVLAQRALHDAADKHAPQRFRSADDRRKQAHLIAVVQGSLEGCRNSVDKHGMHTLERDAKVLDRLAHHCRIAQIDLEEIGLRVRRAIVAQDAVKLDCDLHPEMDRMPW